ncbi:hypothetical protein MRX96_059166 [Rhipicephalus microplus]
MELRARERDEEWRDSRLDRMLIARVDGVRALTAAALAGVHLPSRPRTSREDPFSDDVSIVRCASIDRTRCGKSAALSLPAGSGPRHPSR